MGTQVLGSEVAYRVRSAQEARGESGNIMNDKTLGMIAERFRVLGDPQRLKLLQALSEGERSVADLVEIAASSQANVSKHLGVLLRAGLVTRRKEGLHVFYAAADPAVFALCDLVCGSLKDYLERELRGLAVPPARTASSKRAASPRSTR